METLLLQTASVGRRKTMPHEATFLRKTISILLAESVWQWHAAFETLAAAITSLPQAYATDSLQVTA